MRIEEYEATREQVLEFVADCEKVSATFNAQGVPSESTRELIGWLREKWDAQAKSRGRELSRGGRYGAKEAILRLPRLTRPREWGDDLYSAEDTARSCL